MSIGSRKNDHIEKIQIILQLIIKLSTLVLFKLLFRLQVVGEKEAAAELKAVHANEKGLLFAPNHVSEWDGVMVQTMLPFHTIFSPMYFVAMTKDHYQYEKFGWRKYLYGGTFFKMLGAYPAYLGMRDYHASLVNHIELLEYGKSVCIFPEGKISVNTLKPSEPKGGIGFLAEYTMTDIIPVKLSGFERIDWFKVFTFRRPLVSIIYKPIVRIADVLEKAKTQGVEAGAPTSKFISAYVMDKVRN
ncbi:MAG: lysophospholipid acyltransferase family protein [Patescibacteria group bacterium]